MENLTPDQVLEHGERIHQAAEIEHQRWIQEEYHTPAAVALAVEMPIDTVRRWAKDRRFGCMLDLKDWAWHRWATEFRPDLLKDSRVRFLIPQRDVEALRTALPLMYTWNGDRTHKRFRDDVPSMVTTPSGGIFVPPGRPGPRGKQGEG